MLRTPAEVSANELSSEFYVEPTKGKLLTYTLVTFPPETMSSYTLYILAVAEPEDGSRLLAQMTGVTPKSPQVGMPIRVVSHRITEERIAYKSKPL